MVNFNSEFMSNMVASELCCYSSTRLLNLVDWCGEISYWYTNLARFSPIAGYCNRVPGYRRAYM